MKVRPRRVRTPIRVIAGCALAGAILCLWPGHATRAQYGDPATLPLLQQDGLGYLGAFRAPAYGLDGIDLSYGGKPLAYNPANNSLFIGKSNYLTEISIPSPVRSDDVNDYANATYLQATFVDPTEGHMRDMSASDVVIYGLLVANDRLYGSASIYYDSDNNQRVSHFSRSLRLTQPSFSGWSQVWETGRSGFVSGWMALVPAEWQAVLGGPAITGQCCIPIVSRTSYGPSAFSFDPADIGQPTVAAIPLLYYSSDHATLGPYEGANENYGAAARVGGMAIIAGTRTVLYVGTNGLGTFCYGDGTADESKANGGSLCYDPTDSNRGPHAYPYRYQAWAYDLNELAAVRDRRRDPWEVRPYAVWPLTFPTDAAEQRIGGLAYDMQRQILYVSQLDADRGLYSTGPIIHAFKVTPPRR